MYNRKESINKFYYDKMENTTVSSTFIGLIEEYGMEKIIEGLLALVLQQIFYVIIKGFFVYMVYNFLLLQVMKGFRYINVYEGCIIALVIMTMKSI